jgi:hypothetical protein
MAAGMTALVLIALGATPARAVVPGQTDDFEIGTTQGWVGGPLAGNPNPNPPINVSSGGPGGADDNYLLVRSTGIGTSGSKLVAFNGAQWTGDYLAAGIGAIRMHVSNLGTTDLTLRLILVRAQDVQAQCTVAGVVIDADDDGWHLVEFPLTDANLNGLSDFNTVMSSVTELDLVYAPSEITHRRDSPGIAAELGVDNVTAVPVPEPSVAGAMAAAAVAMVMRRGRGRGRRRASG